VVSIRPYCLSIAGFDPTAGAGVLADIKTFEMNNCYGMAIVTANTLQTDDQFMKVQWLSIEVILKQLMVLLQKYNFQVIKIGLVENSETLYTILKTAKRLKPDIQVVWDPILKSSSGFNFHSKTNLEMEFLEANCTLITPNWDEFSCLWGGNLDLLKQKKINSSILIKGGHRKERVGCDIVFEKGIYTEISGASFNGKSKHGTGCVLSAAISANLSKGQSIIESCKSAKAYIEKFILSNETNLGYHYGEI
jgi:hydroxymethylpyrimidine/phosphomethylpyrimidine kinase